jgi:hypothetical protein
VCPAFDVGTKPDFGNAYDARAWVMAHARTTKQRDAGISDRFGRGCQLVQVRRGGWKRIPAHQAE